MSFPLHLVFPAKIGSQCAAAAMVESTQELPASPFVRWTLSLTLALLSLVTALGCGSAPTVNVAHDDSASDYSKSAAAYSPGRN